MSNKIKKLVAIIVTTMIIIICNTNISKANDILIPSTFNLWRDGEATLENIGIGSVVTIASSTWTWENNDHLYCIQNGQAFHDFNKIKVVEHIQIVGNKSTDHLGNSVIDKKNGRLAYYISYLNGEHKKYHEDHCRGKSSGNSNKDNCIVQNVIWNFMSSWMEVGKQHKLNAGMAAGNSGEDTENTRALDAKAIAYAEQINDNETEEIVDKTRNVKVNLNGANIRIGPFNWEFSGSLQEVKINDQNISEMTVTCFEGTTEKSIGVSGIRSGSDFYINIPINSGIMEIEKISVKAKARKTQADIWFMENTESSCQNIIYVDSSDRDYNFEKELTYNIPLTGNLKIKKKDEDTNVAIADVEFKILNKDINQYVVRTITDGMAKISYTGNANSATTFKTDKNGEIIVKNILFGKYTIIETKNPDPVYGTELKSQDVTVTKASYSKTQIDKKLEDVTWGVVGSPTSKSINWGKSNNAFVKMLYGGILGRPNPSDKEIQGWVNMLRKQK